MIIGSLQARLHFPSPQSLKEKRMILKSLMTKLQNQFNVGSAELDGMDQWQYSMIGIVGIAREKKEVDRLLNQIDCFLNSFDGIVVSDTLKELL